MQVRTTLWLWLLAPAVGAAGQITYVKPGDPGHDDRFGGAVAISGDTLVASAASDDLFTSADVGSVYVFRQSGTTWTEEAKLLPDVADGSDFFGTALALDGDTLVVGAFREDGGVPGVDGNPFDDSASEAGAAYVFERVGTSWSQTAYLKPTVVDAGDQFGWAVDVAGDTIVVGARFEDSSSTGVAGDPNDDGAPMAGSAYVFVKSGSSWTQQAYLKASNTDVLDQFGFSVALDGDTLVVGAISEDGPATGVDGPAGNGAFDAGAGYVFARSGTTWSQQAYLKASNTGASDQFGTSVALDADTIVVGAIQEDSAATGVDGDGLDDSAPASGAAYVFERAGTSWSPSAYLKAPDVDSADRFGETVAIDGDRIAIGAPGEDGSGTGIGAEIDDLAPNAGAVSVFARSGASWSFAALVKASNTGDGDELGVGLGLAGATLVAGAPYEDSAAAGIDGDGGDDSLASAGATYVAALGELGPLVYCTAKASSAGCTASIGTSATLTQPASGASDYAVTATGVQELKNGLVFAGVAGPAALPFNGGTLCVEPPTKRGPILSSGGSSPSGCAGSFATVVNDGLVIPSGLDAGPGNSAWYQYWYRDPAGGAGALGTALSNAVQLDFDS